MSDSKRSSILTSPLPRRTLFKATAAMGAAASVTVAGPHLTFAAPPAQDAGPSFSASFYQSVPNPWLYQGFGIWTSLVFERLVSWDENYANIIPALAESWTTSDDGLVYTFKLRSGVTWHDGAPFTAADIVWSYTTLLNAAIVGSWQQPNLLSIKGAKALNDGSSTEPPAVVAVDDLTVEIILEAPSPLFIQQAAMPMILPKHLLEAVPVETLFDDPYFSEGLVGLGPFKFTEWAREQFITITRFDDYYRGAPALDTIVARYFEQSSVSILAQENGEIDAIHLNNPTDIAAVSPNENVDLFPGPPMVVQSLGVGKSPELLQDKRVRQAIAHAIDRDTIVETFYTGTAQVVDTPFLASWVPMDGVVPLSYDPDRAKALLDEAGWDFDVTLDLSAYYTDPFTGQLLAAFQQYLGDVGIKTEVRQLEWANLEADWTAGTFGLMFQGSSPGPDPDAVYIYFHSESGYNPNLASDPTVDELLDRGRTTLDQTERAQIYSELAVNLVDQQFWIMLWAPLRYWGVNKAVSGVNGFMGTPGLHIPFYTHAETWTKAT